MYQHVCATIPCQHGEQQLMAWLDGQKNQQGYDPVSLSVVMQAAPSLDHAALRNGGPVLLGQQQAIPCWFVILRREVEEPHHVGE